MSGIKLTTDDLRLYAASADLELRVATGDEGAQEILARQATWHGRLSRNLKIPFEDRTQKELAYTAAKAAVQKALVETYGDEIGHKAFKAGIGTWRSEEIWDFSITHPITGRHIAKMLAEADRLLNRHIVDLVGEFTGEMEDGARASLGQKVSRPWPQPIDTSDAHSSITVDLGNDLEQLPPEQQHGFWVLHLESGSGKKDLTLGLHIDRADSDRLDIADMQGNRHQVSRLRLARWLDLHLVTMTSVGPLSIGLYRAQVTVPEREPQDLRDSNEEPSDDDLRVLFEEPGDDQELPPEKTDSPPTESSSDQNSQEEQNDNDPDFGFGASNINVDEPVEIIPAKPGSPESNRLGDARDWIPEADWLEMLGQDRQRLEHDETQRRDTNVPSISLDERRQGDGWDVPLLIRDTDGARINMAVGTVGLARQLTSIKLPGGNLAAGLENRHALGLTRFVHDEMFRQTYGRATRHLGLDPPPKPGAVEVEITAIDEDAEAFDIIFRAQLPDGATVPTGTGDKPGQDCDLVMTLRVTQEQLVELRPELDIPDLSIETHRKSCENPLPILAFSGTPPSASVASAQTQPGIVAPLLTQQETQAAIEDHNRRQETDMSLEPIGLRLSPGLVQRVRDRLPRPAAGSAPDRQHQRDPHRRPLRPRPDDRRAAGRAPVDVAELQGHGIAGRRREACARDADLHDRAAAGPDPGGYANGDPPRPDGAAPRDHRGKRDRAAWGSRLGGSHGGP